MEIFQTTDYDKFQIIVSNREVDKSHVKKLAESIKRKNLLFIRPLIVNEKMELIDGQHRLQAAALIKAPVFYVKASGLTKTDITVLNTAQKNWTRIDFINFYAIEGVPEFKQLSKLINKYSHIKVSAIITLCTANQYGLRQGKIYLANYDRAVMVCEWITTLKTKYRFVLTRDFALGLNDACTSEDSFQKLQSVITTENFHQCYSRIEYQKMIQSILN